MLQRVYGVTTATVRVGYEYRDCGNSFDGLVWHIETTRMSGHDLASTDIGGWNLHVQHKYNFHSGILQKGDGNTIYLKYKPQVIFKFQGEKTKSKGSHIVHTKLVVQINLPKIGMTYIF